MSFESYGKNFIVKIMKCQAEEMERAEKEGHRIYGRVKGGIEDINVRNIAVYEEYLLKIYMQITNVDAIRLR